MKEDHSLRDLIVGLLFFCGGVFLIFQNTMVTASWGFYIGNMHVSSGMVIIPFIIGIIWKTMDPKSMGAWLLMGIGLLCILLTIMMGVRIRFITTSLFDYVLMFGLTAVGLGLLLKALFLSNRK